MGKSREEKSPFSNLNHIGVIVRDIDKAVAHFSSLGLGPFEIPPPPPPSAEGQLRGNPTDVTNAIKVRNSKIGQIQLEVIQPVSKESPAQEFLDKRGEGINHLGFVVDDLDKEMTKLVNQGFKVLTRVKSGDGGMAYFETDAVGGILLELIQSS